ncbi:MAG: beta-phosphoglucomutase family hydrolase [Candidatus Wallbacteria bacterium]|nr:beta-phosphoglucomutase family hydrolase [Candidatus Wallbacteria bacterium]
MASLNFEAAIFDLDGVVTKTAKVHARAWKETFDEYLRLRQERDRESFAEFTYERDYLTFVDGKPRYQGVKSFLESRSIFIPFGNPDDAPGSETVCGIGNRKNLKFNEVLEEQGVEVFESTVALIRDFIKAGVKVGVASSSKNCSAILSSAKLETLFEARVCGEVSAQLGLKGKPHGDIFITAASQLGVAPDRAIVFEDATSGVQAGRNGGFGLVLGIARENNRKELLENGADLVVSDLSEISVGSLDSWFSRESSPTH